MRSKLQDCWSEEVDQEAWKPFFSTDSSDRNLMIMKLEAEVKVVVFMSCRLPDRVAMFTAVSSVLPPPRI